MIQNKEPRTFCEWIEENEGVWNPSVWSTSCKNWQIFEEEGDPSDNRFKFCPFCGFRIRVVVKHYGKPDVMGEIVWLEGEK